MRLLITRRIGRCQGPIEHFLMDHQTRLGLMKPNMLTKKGKIGFASQWSWVLKIKFALLGANSYQKVGNSKDIDHRAIKNELGYLFVFYLALNVYRYPLAIETKIQFYQLRS